MNAHQVASGAQGQRPQLSCRGKSGAAQAADAQEGHPEGVQGTQGMWLERRWCLLQGAKLRKGPRAGQVDPRASTCPHSDFISIALSVHLQAGASCSVFSRDSDRRLPRKGGDSLRAAVLPGRPLCETGFTSVPCLICFQTVCELSLTVVSLSLCLRHHPGAASTMGDTHVAQSAVAWGASALALLPSACLGAIPIPGSEAEAESEFGAKILNQAESGLV